MFACVGPFEAPLASLQPPSDDALTCAAVLLLYRLLVWVLRLLIRFGRRLARSGKPRRSWQSGVVLWAGDVRPHEPMTSRPTSRPTTRANGGCQLRRNAMQRRRTYDDACTHSVYTPSQVPGARPRGCASVFLRLRSRRSHRTFEDRIASRQPWHIHALYLA